MLTAHPSLTSGQRYAVLLIQFFSCLLSYNQKFKILVCVENPVVLFTGCLLYIFSGITYLMWIEKDMFVYL